jgi:hypothetical protein
MAGLDDDTVIWRYMSFWKFVSMLDGPSLFFPETVPV